MKPTTRRLKRPNGQLYEEYHTATVHIFESGKFTMSSSEAREGEYTGRFWFEFEDGKVTPIYTIDNAPKWLLAYYNEATA